MDLVTKAKWDNAALAFDLMNGRGPEKRWEPIKRQLFSHMRGKVLFLAVGTGLDIRFYFELLCHVAGVAELFVAVIHERCVGASESKKE